MVQSYPILMVLTSELYHIGVVYILYQIRLIRFILIYINSYSKKL